VDASDKRKVTTSQAQQWCRENGDLPYYETSAIDNILVEEAFMEMAREAVQREARPGHFMPETIGGAGGTIRLSAHKKSPYEEAKKKKKKCKC